MSVTAEASGGEDNVIMLKATAVIVSVKLEWPSEFDLNASSDCWPLNYSFCYNVGKTAANLCNAISH